MINEKKEGRSEVGDMRVVGSLNSPQMWIYHGGALLKKFVNIFCPAIPQHQHAEMEEDRAEVDLGVAMDVEERLEEAAAQRQPKKRFVGRKQAAEAALRSGANESVEDSGAIQSRFAFKPSSMLLLLRSSSI